MFARSRFQGVDAEEAARFLAGVGERNSALSSGTLGRRSGEALTAAQLLAEDRHPDRLGTFLLKRDGAIAALVRVDDRQDGGRAAVFSGVEVGPTCRRGTFWRLLGGPLIRAFSTTAFDRLEAVVDSDFEARGGPVYKRFGFRTVPDSSPTLMENYLPTIIRHPAARPFFSRHDFLTSLENRPSGDDGIGCGSLNLFAYAWSAGSERLQVMVDWERRQIVSIERRDWVACCFAVWEESFKVHYWVRNKGKRSIGFCVERQNGEHGRHRLQPIAPCQTASGDIFVADTVGSASPAPVTAVSVILTIDSERVPFQLRRLKARRGPPRAGRVQEPTDKVGWDDLRAPLPPSSSPRFPLAQFPSASPPGAIDG